MILMAQPFLLAFQGLGLDEFEFAARKGGDVHGQVRAVVIGKVADGRGQPLRIEITHGLKGCLDAFACYFTPGLGHFHAFAHDHGGHEAAHVVGHLRLVLGQFADDFHAGHVLTVDDSALQAEMPIGRVAGQLEDVLVTAPDVGQKGAGHAAFLRILHDHGRGRGGAAGPDEVGFDFFEAQQLISDLLLQSHKKT